MRFLGDELLRPHPEERALARVSKDRSGYGIKRILLPAFRQFRQPIPFPFDHGLLLGARPTLDLTFGRDGIGNGLEVLSKDQSRPGVASLCTRDTGLSCARQVVPLDSCAWCRLSNCRRRNARYTGRRRHSRIRLIIQCQRQAPAHSIKPPWATRPCSSCRRTADPSGWRRLRGRGFRCIPWRCRGPPSSRGWRCRLR